MPSIVDVTLKLASSFTVTTEPSAFVMCTSYGRTFGVGLGALGGGAGHCGFSGRGGLRQVVAGEHRLGDAVGLVAALAPVGSAVRVGRRGRGARRGRRRRGGVGSGLRVRSADEAGAEGTAEERGAGHRATERNLAEGVHRGDLLVIGL